MGVRLPAEYQEVPFIIGQGSQYIDTGYVLNSECRVQGRYDLYESTKLGSVVALFGARDSNYNNAFAMFNVTAAPRIDYGETLTTHSFYYVTINDRSVVDFDLNAGIATVNGRTYAFADSLKPFTCPSTALIFAAHTENTVDTRRPKGEIVYLKITDENGIVVRDMVPCYRKSDNKPGMFDLVNKQFYTNQGTGEFLVGPDVVNHISPRLMDRRRVLIAKLTSLFRKVITSQTGLVSFDTNIAKPMKVTCEFSPKQDLHGYDNPWPAGGGKNMFMSHAVSDTVHDVTFTANSDGTVTVNGTATSDIIFTISKKLASSPGDGSYCHLSDLGITGGNSYILNGCPSGGNTGGYRLQLLVYGSGTEPSDPGTGSSIFTFSESDVAEKWYRLAIRIYNGTVCNNLVFKPMIRLSSVSDASYASYENICPIEAWDGANIPHTGVNIWDEEWEVGEYGTSGQKVNSGYGIRCKNYIRVNPSGSYRFVAQNTLYVCSYDTNKNFLERAIIYTSSPVKQLANNCVYITFNTASAYGTTYNNDISINYPSTDTTYHAYTNTTLPITFNNPGTYDFLPIQEGTGDPSPENIRPITPGLTITRDDSTTLEVWGGSLTVNSDGTGSLEATYYNLDCKSINWVIGNGISSGIYYFHNSFSVDVPECLYDPGQIDLCKNVEKYSHGIIENPYIVQTSCGWAYNTVSRIGFEEGSGIDTIEAFNAWLNEQSVCQIVYPLKTPTTYTLSVAETSRAFEALGLGKNLGPLYGGTVTVNEDGSADLDSRWVIRNLGQMNDIVKTGGSGVWEHRFDCRHYISGSGYDSGRRNGEPDDIMCSALKWGNAASNGTYLTYSSIITVYDDTVSSVAEFREKYADVQICYIGNDYVRQQYHFDNLGQLQSFLGTNNVWSDLNGAITVEYYKKQQ